MKNDHINSICDHFEVSLGEIYEYNRKNRDKIKDMDNIFRLEKRTKVELVLALFYLLTYGEEDEAIRKYRDETFKYTWSYTAKALINEYKYMILTAMVYNEYFYSMSVNYFGFVKSGLSVGLPDKVGDDSEEEERSLRTEIEFLAADSPGYELRQIGKIIETVDINGIYRGDLRTFANLKTGEMALRFRCYDKATGQAVDRVPFTLKVEIEIVPLNIKHFITLDKTINSSTISSAARQFESLGRAIRFHRMEIIEGSPS